ncbi:hypothetical protein [Psychroserpens sp.]|uniref:hypothetical protein n=1 Tax=Psychroserpens sp. TaxID=2020870 RepID=UPI003C77E1C5
MKHSLFNLVFCALLFTACQGDKNNTTNSAETSVIKTKNEGAIQQINTAANLIEKGVKINRAFLVSSTKDSVANAVTLQLNFDRDFHDVIYIKVMDKTDGKEKRAKLEIKGEQGHIDDFSFTFNKNVDIDTTQPIIVE